MGIEVKDNLDWGKKVQDLKRAQEMMLSELGVKLLKTVKESWTGFKNPTGQSREAWQVVIERGVITLSNDYGYVAHVHLAGQSKPRFEQILEGPIDEVLQAFMKETEKKISEVLNGRE